MATKKRAKKKGRKTASKRRSSVSVFKKASMDKSYRAAKKRATAAVRKASAAYKAAVRKAKKARK